MITHIRISRSHFPIGKKSMHGFTMQRKLSMQAVWIRV